MDNNGDYFLILVLVVLVIYRTVTSKAAPAMQKKQPHHSCHIEGFMGNVACREVKEMINQQSRIEVLMEVLMSRTTSG